MGNNDFFIKRLEDKGDFSCHGVGTFNYINNAYHYNIIKDFLPLFFEEQDKILIVGIEYNSDFPVVYKARFDLLKKELPQKLSSIGIYKALKTRDSVPTQCLTLSTFSKDNIDVLFDVMGYFYFSSIISLPQSYDFDDILKEANKFSFKSILFSRWRKHMNYGLNIDAEHGTFGMEINRKYQDKFANIRNYFVVNSFIES